MTALDTFEIQDLLDNLVERSMVVCDTTTGRYHMSESMRAYAHDALGEEEASVKQRHFRYFDHMAEGFRLFGSGGDDRRIIKSFVHDIDNFRGALSWSLTNDPESHLHLAGNTSPVWGRMYARESIHNLRSALSSVPEADDADHIWARGGLAHTLLRTGELEEVEALLNTVTRQLEVTDIPLARVTTLLRRAWYATWTGNLEAIRPLCAQAIEVCTKHGLKYPLSVVHLHLGDFARMQEDWGEACRSYEAALEFAPEDGIVKMVISFNLGGVAIESDNVDAAESWYRRSISVSQKLFDTDEAENAYDGTLGLGYVLLKRGDYRGAGLLIGRAESRLRAFGISLDPLDLTLFMKMVALGREAGGETFENALIEGSHLSENQIKDMIFE